jgi:alkanesulfonate monooxygenase SsuD/methylene tetrahydromethanopterin reductase-like flavin-dependent oxidoreductase (luciferase family)
MEGFGVAATDTRRFRNEALSIIGKALSQETFEHHGELYEIPERSLAPKPVQKPHPPMFLAATSPASHWDAGKMGIGVMTGNTSAGWEYAQECIDTYRKATSEAEPITGVAQDTLSMISTGVNCSHDDRDAKEGAKPVAAAWMRSIMRNYQRLAKESPDYAYLANIRKLQDRMYDLDYLVDSSPYMSAGTPEFFVERANLLNEMGVDEWILRLDGMPHEQNKKAIQLIGREVLPEVKKLRRKVARPVPAL